MGEGGCSARVQPGSKLMYTATLLPGHRRGLKGRRPVTPPPSRVEKTMEAVASKLRALSQAVAMGPECAPVAARGDAGRTNWRRLSSSWRRSLPRTFSPLGVEGGPGRHAGKEATGDDEEEVEDILRRQGVLPWTNYISPLQASWFQVGQQEREALKKGFDDAADKRTLKPCMRPGSC